MDNWSPVGGTILEGLEGVTLEEAGLLGFEVSNGHAIPS